MARLHSARARRSPRFPMTLVVCCSHFWLFTRLWTTAHRYTPTSHVCRGWCCFPGLRDLGKLGDQLQCIDYIDYKYHYIDQYIDCIYHYTYYIHYIHCITFRPWGTRRSAAAARSRSRRPSASGGRRPSAME